VITEGKADAVSAASIFHYNCLEKQPNISEFKEEGNIEFIRQRRDGLGFMNEAIKRTGIREVKENLKNAGIECRI
jgi:hypothetical protein